MDPITKVVFLVLILTMSYCIVVASEKNKDTHKTFRAFELSEPDPDTPETPEIPETPETPEIPETPETPEIPETPETPETPDIPTPPSPPPLTPIQNCIVDCAIGCRRNWKFPLCIFKCFRHCIPRQFLAHTMNDNNLICQLGCASMSCLDHKTGALKSEACIDGCSEKCSNHYTPLVPPSNN